MAWQKRQHIGGVVAGPPHHLNRVHTATTPYHHTPHHTTSIECTRPPQCHQPPSGTTAQAASQAHKANQSKAYLSTPYYTIPEHNKAYHSIPEWITVYQRPYHHHTTEPSMPNHSRQQSRYILQSSREVQYQYSRDRGASSPLPGHHLCCTKYSSYYSLLYYSTAVSSLLLYCSTVTTLLMQQSLLYCCTAVHQLLLYCCTTVLLCRPTLVTTPFFPMKQLHSSPRAYTSSSYVLQPSGAPYSLQVPTVAAPWSLLDPGNHWRNLRQEVPTL